MATQAQVQKLAQMLIAAAPANGGQKWLNVLQESLSYDFATSGHVLARAIYEAVNNYEGTP